MMYASRSYSTASFLAEGSEEIDGDVHVTTCTSPSMFGVSVICLESVSLPSNAFDHT